MGDLTDTLLAWSQSTKAQRDRVIASLYEELRCHAARQLRGENGIDVQPTILINETYMRLINVSRMDFNGRAHFLALAGKIMRDVLIDQARSKRAQKRDYRVETILTNSIESKELPVLNILEWDSLLNALEQIDPIYVRIFESRIFSEMTFDEIAVSLELSTSTIKRKWRVAVAWLKNQLDESGG